MKTISIIGSGVYLPSKKVSTKNLAEERNIDYVRIEQTTGVKERRYASKQETSVFMGTQALINALRSAEIQISDLDLIICASAVPAQAIPTTSALIQREFGKEAEGIPCFDINSTCLSFVTALDHITPSIITGRYKKVAIISSERASIALNESEIESSFLFGDGAVAFILSQKEFSHHKILAADMNTYGEGASTTEIKGGGTNIEPSEYAVTPIENFLFHMEGKKIFKLSLKKVPAFFDRLLEQAGCSLQELQLIIPHQASGAALKIMRKQLSIEEHQFMSIIENYGNMVSVSIPLALHFAIEEGRIQRGDKVMVIGTSAGLSIGGIIFEY